MKKTISRSLAYLLAAMLIFGAAVYIKDTTGNFSAAAEAAAGAGVKTASTSNTDVPAPGNQPTRPSGGRMKDFDIVYGQVTAINGDQLNLAMGTINSDQAQSMPQGRSPGRPRGISPGDELTLTGETITVTITPDIALTVSNAGTEPGKSDGMPGIATLADITVGSIVMLTYGAGTDTLQALEILSGIETATL